MSSDTEYLNVDLDIAARGDLQPLVDAFGKRVFALHVTRLRGRCLAALELAATTNTADQAIQRLAALVASLPPAARRLWNAASVRDFNIGIQAGRDPYAFSCVVSKEAVAAVTAVGGRVVITVYGSAAGEDTRTSRGRKRGTSKSRGASHD